MNTQKRKFIKNPNSRARKLELNWILKRVCTDDNFLLPVKKRRRVEKVKPEENTRTRKKQKILFHGTNKKPRFLRLFMALEPTVWITREGLNKNVIFLVIHEVFFFFLSYRPPALISYSAAALENSKEKRVGEKESERDIDIEKER